MEYQKIMNLLDNTSNHHLLQLLLQLVIALIYNLSYLGSKTRVELKGSC